MNDPRNGFTEEQMQWLAGFAAGAENLRHGGKQPSFRDLPGAVIPPREQTGPDALMHQAQDRFRQQGLKLVPEEVAKSEKPPLDIWPEITANAAEGKFPKGTDALLYKFHGLFHVAPAQDSFMCRLRFPAGIVQSHQLRAVANLARELGDGVVAVTTRANFQIRGIGAGNAPQVLNRLQEAGIVTRGAGADNIRNITGTPTAGFDPVEWYDIRPLAWDLHHAILQQRWMYGLPRKFNIAFDGGGRVASLEDTNDIGFSVCRVEHGKAVSEGVWFRLLLGGITGHKDFARDTGLLLAPGECVQVATAMVRVFLDHGDRTDRKKARLKYLLDQWGVAKFLEETAKHLPFPLRRFPLDQCVLPPPAERAGHLGVQAQKQPEKAYVGVVVPVGRLEAEQCKGIANLADRYGEGEVRLTVWQNLLIPHINKSDVPAVERELAGMGLSIRADSYRCGMVACTGSRGCKYAASDTKGHALALADYLDARGKMSLPVNFHFTGCHHSCAQHYIGDLGFLGAKVPLDREEEGEAEGYRIFVGGGFGDRRDIARELGPALPFDSIPPVVERLLLAWSETARTEGVTFQEFTRNHSTEELRQLAGLTPGVAV